jgi:hypothetical protein
VAVTLTAAQALRFVQNVPVDRSKQQIEALLLRAGAEGFHTGWQAPTGDDPGWDALEFLWKGKQIRFKLARQASYRAALQAQRDRQRWRILYLVIKAKLEGVQAGVAIFEEEFMSFIVTGSGKPVGEILVPRLNAGGPLQLGSGQ